MFKQIWRGCGTLPHVGEHPGTVPTLFLIAITGLACAAAGWQGVAVGIVIGSIFYVPMYLYGAYSRAKLSDSLSRRDLAS